MKKFHFLKANRFKRKTNKRPRMHFHQPIALKLFRQKVVVSTPSRNLTKISNELKPLLPYLEKKKLLFQSPKPEAPKCRLVKGSALPTGLRVFDTDWKNEIYLDGACDEGKYLIIGASI